MDCAEKKLMDTLVAGESKDIYFLTSFIPNLYIPPSSLWGPKAAYITFLFSILSLQQLLS